MMNIAIIENDTLWVNKIQAILREQEIYRDVSVSSYYSAEEFLLSPPDFQIVLMDVELGGMNGLLASWEYKKNHPDCIVILVTFYEKYCIDGYKVEAFRFVKKEKLREELTEALESALPYLKDSRTLSFSVWHLGMQKFRAKDILYFETEKRMVAIHTCRGRYYTAEGITDLSERLKEYGFYSPHKSYLVNLKWVRDILAKESRKYVCMKNEDYIPLSRSKEKEMQELLWQYRFDRANG